MPCQLNLPLVLVWLLFIVGPAFAGQLEIGQKLAKQQRFDEAADVLQQARRLRPADLRTGLVLGSVLRAATRTDEAIVVLQRVLSIAPNVKVGLQLGYALREKLEASAAKMRPTLTQRIVDVLEPVANASKGNPPSATDSVDVAALQLELGVALQELGRQKAAAVWYKRLLQQTEANKGRNPRLNAPMARANLNLGSLSSLRALVSFRLVCSCHRPPAAAVVEQDQSASRACHQSRAA
jgi:tetratricopeptide (TPR) repeat protein